MKKHPHDPADDPEALSAYLSAACADDADLLATVLALAEAGEHDLLRLVRDFRDNAPGEEILRRHGPTQEAVDGKLRLIHRVYVECARQVREASGRPERARRCYETRMLGRRDNYQAMLDDAQEGIPPEVRQVYQKLIGCAREKVPYDALPARLGGDALAVQEEVLRLRQRFKDWAARRKVRAESAASGGVCDG